MTGSAPRTMRMVTGLAMAAIVTAGLCQPALAATSTEVPSASAITSPVDLSAARKGTVNKAETTANLNVRTEAGTEHRVLDVLPKGTSVTLSQKSDGAWKYITSDELSGWVHGDYLSSANVVAAQTVKTTANLNFRSGAGLEHKVLELLTKGDSVTLTGETDDVWRQAMVEGVTGWVHGEYLASLEEPTSSTQPKKKSKASSTTPSGKAVQASGSITAKTEAMVDAVNENFGSSHYDAVHGYRAGSKGHSSGKAADFMIRDYKSDAGIERGDEIAQYLIENRKALGINYVIWRDQIWLSTSGWTQYSGVHGGQFNGNWNDTTLHNDHVHAETY